jgi:hypothetical protein
MLRIIFFVIVLMHGLIHLLGFIKAFELAEIPQLGMAISKPRGLIWLLCVLLFIAAMFLFLFKKDWWWMLALPAVLLSQILVFAYWQDAKFGSIPNIIVLITCLIAYGQWQFQRESMEKRKQLLPASQAQSDNISEAGLPSLPKPVSRWLRTCGAVNKTAIHTVYLRQGGEMRTSPDGKWMPVVAEQWFTLTQPGFLWTADVGSGLMQFAGRDFFYRGQGSMLIKVQSLLPVVDAKGEAINQGTMLRFLSEMVWFPTAALQPYIQWEAIDDRQARATIQYDGQSASGIFTFSEQGQVLSFDARRYYQRKEEATLEDWHIAVEPGSYREFEGISVPTQASVTWQLQEGDYTWFRLNVQQVAYDTLP